MKAIEYRGYKISTITDPWAIHFKLGKYEFTDGERIWHSETIEEAKEEIDWLIELFKTKTL